MASNLGDLYLPGYTLILSFDIVFSHTSPHAVNASSLPEAARCPNRSYYLRPVRVGHPSVLDQGQSNQSAPRARF
jgi:hypothetical protein